MFTGIVQEKLKIIDLTAIGDGLTVVLSLPHWGEISVGESILLHGICSTVVKITNDHFSVYYMAETRRLTTVDSWSINELIHAEPALTLQSRLSGSLVTGHIEGTARVTQTNPLTFSLPDKLMKFMLAQGGITIDGVNLTISTCQANELSVNLIPATIAATKLGELEKGDVVNIESDYFTRLTRTWWDEREYQNKK